MTASAVPPALHPLLERQLRKLGLKPGQAADAKTLDALLARVLQVYADVDQERDLLHRSQELASGAMATLNEALHASRALLASLLSLSSDWVWEQDEDGRFVTVSDDLLLRTGIDAGALIGQTCSIEGPLRATLEDLAQLELHQAARQVFRDINFELDAGPGAPGALAQPGTTRHLRISGEPVFDGPRRLGCRGVGSDATATVQADRKIQELAHYDSLTGLPNRHLVMEELGRALARSTRHDSAFALLFIDLDRFKYVNDNLGHAAGDELLRTVGQRLRQMLREVDMLGRLGGDEFVVLTEGRCEPGTLTRLAGRILAAVAEPLVLGGRSVRISASVGISIFPGDGSEAETLMRHADAARYQAKPGGKNAFGFFTPELARRAARGAALFAGKRPARRDRSPRAGAALPAAGGRARGRAAGPASAGALAAPAARTADAGRLHRARRRQRPHRAAGPLGAARELPPDGGVACRRPGAPAGGRQRLGTLTSPTRPSPPPCTTRWRWAGWKPARWSWRSPKAR